MASGTEAGLLRCASTGLAVGGGEEAEGLSTRFPVSSGPLTVSALSLRCAFFPQLSCPNRARGHLAHPCLGALPVPGVQC